LRKIKKFIDAEKKNDNLEVGDQPPEVGQIYVARGVIFKPQDTLPESNQEEGELAYSAGDKAFYAYNGTDMKFYYTTSITGAISSVDTFQVNLCPKDYYNEIADWTGVSLYTGYNCVGNEYAYNAQKAYRLSSTCVCRADTAPW